jgi:hypothetical protein
MSPSKIDDLKRDLLAFDLADGRKVDLPAAGQVARLPFYFPHWKLRR